MHIALLVVDIQKDFLAGGALAVSGADDIIDPANRLIRRFEEKGKPIFLSRDWHPANHCSFQDQGGEWPAHCVANTPGAAFADALYQPEGAVILSKATNASREAYSDFDGSDLARQLDVKNIDHLVVLGLATDYCIKASVIDAVGEGYTVTVVSDAIRPVEVHPGDSEKAIEEMRHLGAHFASSDEALKMVDSVQ